MRRSGKELRHALLLALLVTIGYLVGVTILDEIPESGDLLGHLLGGVGFTAMLMTELLYSMRKRYQRAARWGRMDSWLKFHIITGIVGPYMVLLHSAWQFNGLAGAITLLMVLIVASGFIGRYVYTMVPRTAAGEEVSGRAMEHQVIIVESGVSDWLAAHPDVVRNLAPDLFSLPEVSGSPWSLLFGRILLEWGYRWRWRSATRGARGAVGRQLDELRVMLASRRQLHYQTVSLILARRLLALWHAVHVPLGLVLFTTAFIHVGVTLYYSTLAR